jgi:hypothetical protein
MEPKTLDKILAEIGHHPKGAIRASPTLKKLNRYQDGYQPSYVGKISYFMDEKKIAEEVALAETDQELNFETEGELRNLYVELTKAGYKTKLDGLKLIYEQKE